MITVTHEPPSVVSGSKARTAGGMIVAALALAMGIGIAWIDTRPGWDDTGITAGALLAISAIASTLGLRWWLAAGLVAAPILLAEFSSAGPSILLALAFAVAGSLVGVALRGQRRPRVSDSRD